MGIDLRQVLWMYIIVLFIMENVKCSNKKKNNCFQNCFEDKSEFM